MPRFGQEFRSDDFLNAIFSMTVFGVLLIDDEIVVLQDEQVDRPAICESIRNPDNDWHRHFPVR